MQNADNFDKKQTNNDDAFKGDDPAVLKENMLLLQRPSIQALFDGYEFYPYGGGSLIMPQAPIKNPKKHKKQASLELEKK